MMKSRSTKIAVASTKDKILKASVRLIEREGLDGFSLRKLAANINMDPMAVYHYFSSKKSLLIACLQTIFLNFSVSVDSNNKRRIKVKSEGKIAKSGRKELDYFVLREMLGSYRKIYLLYPNLSRYVLNHPECSIAEIDKFNQLLIGEIQSKVSDFKETILIRDILVDFIHGYCLAEISIAKRNNNQKLEMETNFQRSFRFLLKKLLES